MLIIFSIARESLHRLWRCETMVHDLRTEKIHLPIIPRRDVIQRRLSEVRRLAEKLEILLVTADQMDAVEAREASHAAKK